MAGTPLEEIIKAEIAASGPMTVHRYMELCLGHPEHGYYMTRDPFGAAGDFTTAPEVSQMFGEMLGAWVAAVWDSMDRPYFRLIELGPGRGTLMADVLRVLGHAGAAPQVWLVETSPRLREEQAQRVPSANWADRLQDVPDGPQIIVANEFFDALPAHQYLIDANGARQAVIGLGPDGTLSRGLSGHRPAAVDQPVGWQERSPATDAVAQEIAARLSKSAGALLAIDYGYTSADRPDGPTLQAVRANRKVAITDQPGASDLTTLVDFDNLTARLTPLASHLTGQGAFLAAMGIGHRAAALASAVPESANAVADALERLTSPNQMGTLFKVLGAVPEGLPTPPGFAGDAHA
ncbi:MAG: SAM-dependent methyltransferase [Pseudomonadota bacterium]